MGAIPPKQASSPNDGMKSTVGTGKVDTDTVAKVTVAVDCDVPPCVGTRVEIFWPQDKAWYSARVFGRFGKTHRVRYEDDNAVESVFMSKEQWRPAAPLHHAGASDSTTTSTPASHTKADVESASKSKAKASSEASASTLTSTTGTTPSSTSASGGGSPPSAPCDVPPCAGDHIEVFWDQDNAWYPARVVGAFGSLHSVRYTDDNAVEKLRLLPGTWRPARNVEETADTSNTNTNGNSDNAGSGGGGGGKSGSGDVGGIVDSAGEGLVGKEISVYWEDDDTW
jgi:hypothetical protein